MPKCMECGEELPKKMSETGKPMDIDRNAPVFAISIKCPNCGNTNAFTLDFRDWEPE